MKKILLIGDSIRLGYDDYVKESMKNVAEVYYPAENCQSAAVVLTTLHAWADGARVLHTGVDRDWTAVAELISSLWSSRGLASGWTTPEELPTALRDMPAQPDVFHDPFLDGPSTVLPLKVIVWGAETTDLANATAVEAPASGLGHLGQVHRLITRGFAVTTYNGSEDDAL